MPIIIDGHNLIPKINGINLSDLDDEMALIEILINYANIHRKKIEVYFDDGAIGCEGSQQFGRVIAFFVRSNITADQAIINRLKNINDSAHNWIVVSSDRWIQKNARQIGAKIISSQNRLPIDKEYETLKKNKVNLIIGNPDIGAFEYNAVGIGSGTSDGVLTGVTVNAIDDVDFTITGAASILGVDFTHTHAYLPLTGGTVTGDLDVVGTVDIDGRIRFAITTDVL